MAEPIHILLVENDSENTRTIREMLHQKNRFQFAVEAVTGLDEALTRLATNPVDLVLLDLSLVSSQAENEAVQKIVAAYRNLALIVLTELEHEQAGLKALELGAQDYLLKGEIGTRTLVRALNDAVKRQQAEERLRQNEKRREYFLKLNEALRSLDDLVQIQEAVAALAIDFYQADRCFYGEVEGGSVLIRRDASRGDLPSVAGIYPLNSLPIFKGVAETGQPIIVPDVHTTNTVDEELRQRCIQMQIIAYINIPIIKKGQYVGNLCISQSTPRNWTPAEVELAAETAERTWVVIECARAKADLAADLQDTRLLHELSVRLVSEDDLQVFCQEIITAAMTLMHADAGTVQILEESSQELRLLATQGFVHTMTDHFDRVDARSSTSCGVALANGTRTVTRYDQGDSDDSARRHLEAGYVTGQSVPLITRSGQPIGMVSTHWREHHTPSEHELRYLDLLARQAADLIERIRAQNALRASQKILQTFYDTAPFMLGIGEIEGDQLIAVSANRMTAEFFAKAASDMAEKSGGELGTPQAIDALWLAQLRLSQQNGTPVYFEYEDPRVPDTPWLGVTVAIIGTAVSGRPQYSFIAENITQRKQLEVIEHEQRLLAEGLRDTAIELSGALTLEEVLECALTSARRLIAFDAATIVLTDKGRPLQSHTLGFTQREQATIERWYQKQADLNAADLYHRAVETHHAMHFQNKNSGWHLPKAFGQSLLIMPLWREETVIGYLTLSKRQSKAFVETDLPKLEALAYQVVSAIQSVQRYQQAQELAVLQERHKIARDLHDAVSQTLFSASSITQALNKQMEGHYPEQITILLATVNRLTQSAMAEMRTLLLELSPTNVHSATFNQLLRQLAQAAQGRKLFEIELKLNGEAKLPPEVHLALYRMAQEALNNVIKHSQATQVWIENQGGAGYMDLHIRDNGKGFAVDQATGGMGMGNMRERAAEVKADLAIHSTLGEGTDIHIVWPHDLQSQSG